MIHQYRKCFVTVGTTRFDRLCKCVLTSRVQKVLKKLGCEEITLQIGNSDTDLGPGELNEHGLKLHVYRFKDSIQKDISEADLVISHAGAGSCLETLEASKPLLVVVNEDLMDNHQLELAEQLQIGGHLYYCTCDTLESTLGEVDFSLLTPFPKPNLSLFQNFLNNVFTAK